MPCGENASYDADSKSCVCEEGWRAIEYDSSGQRLTSIDCEECPENEYQGPNTPTVWECKACPHFAMVYNKEKNPWQCECKDDWQKAGNTCVKKDLRQQLDADGWLPAEAYMTSYYTL